jgi:transcriptional regulator with XRE-family HTH domain
LGYHHHNGDKCTIQDVFVVTSAQIRAARGLLNWTVRDLADRSGVHRNTVTRVETEATGPGHSIAAIRAALEAAGVEFIPENGGGAGVRLSKPGAGA